MAGYDIPRSAQVLAPLRLQLGTPATRPPRLILSRGFLLPYFKPLSFERGGDFSHYFVYFNFGERAVERLEYDAICERYFSSFFKSIKQRDFNSQSAGF